MNEKVIVLIVSLAGGVAIGKIVSVVYQMIDNNKAKTLFIIGFLLVAIILWTILV